MSEFESIWISSTMKNGFLWLLIMQVTVVNVEERYTTSKSVKRGSSAMMARRSSVHSRLKSVPLTFPPLANSKVTTAAMRMACSSRKFRL